MARVTKTELNQQTARVLARVAAGESLTITDRGIPIAEIVPAKPMSRWEELVAAGKVTPAKRRGPLTHPPVQSELTTEEIIDDIRRDHS